MGIVASATFTGIGSASIVGRTLNNASGGSGTWTWYTSGAASLFGNGSDDVIGNSQTQHNCVTLDSTVKKMRKRYNPNGATSQIMLIAERTVTGTSAGNYVMALLIAGHTSFRIIEGSNQSMPTGTDRSTLTITAPGATFWVEVEIVGLVVYARILNDDLSVRNETSYTFPTATPGGTNWGFGFASSGASGIWTEVVFEDAGAGDTTAPTLTGAITEVSKTENSISISWLAGSDNVAVTSYEVSTNGGSSWTNTGNTTLSRTFTGLTPSTAYAIHVRAKDAAGNVSTPALTTSITTLAADTTAPDFGAATLNAGTKTNSSIALSTSAVATDNVAVTGYEWSSDNGATYPFTSLSNSFTFTALTALTAYNFRVRAYDGAGNRSTHLSLTTSTYRAGDTGQFIIDNTGPVGGNPAGILYNDVVLPGDADKWFSFLITTPPANAGSLTIDPQGRFTWVGMSADSFYYQLEVEGANVGSPVLVSLGPAGPTPLNATKRTPNGMIGFWNR